MKLSSYSVYLRLLRISLAVGAVYDAVFGTVLLVAPELPQRLLGLPLPSPEFYLWMLAVLLWILAAVYALAAYDPWSYRGNVLIAIAGRGSAGLVLLYAAWSSGFPGLYVAAAVELAFAAVHAVFWLPTRRR